jgi:hypothetical protein
MVLAGFQRGRYSSEGRPSTTFAASSPPHPTTPPRRDGSLFLSGGHAACECRHPTMPPKAHSLRCMVEAAKTEVFLADGSTSWRKACFHTSRGRSRASSRTAALLTSKGYRGRCAIYRSTPEERPQLKMPRAFVATTAAAAHSVPRRLHRSTRIRSQHTNHEPFAADTHREEPADNPRTIGPSSSRV